MKYAKRKHCNLQKIRIQDIDEFPSFRSPESEKHNFGTVSVNTITRKRLEMGSEI
ncbi:hypothetical protein AVEN_149370-1, partial [Araneus ventricosus]